MPPMSPRAITPFPPKGRPGAGLRRAGAEPVRCPRCPAAAGCFGGSRDPSMQPPGEQHCGACRCPSWAGFAGGWWSWGAGHGGVNPWGPHRPPSPKFLGCPKTFGIPMGAGGVVLAPALPYGTWKMLRWPHDPPPCHGSRDLGVPIYKWGATMRAAQVSWC